MESRCLRRTWGHRMACTVLGLRSLAGLPLGSGEPDPSQDLRIWAIHGEDKDRGPLLTRRCGIEEGAVSSWIPPCFSHWLQ